MSTDSQTGEIHHTGNALDLALMGPGYFAVQTPQRDPLHKKRVLSTERDWGLG